MRNAIDINRLNQARPIFILRHEFNGIQIYPTRRRHTALKPHSERIPRDAAKRSRAAGVLPDGDARKRRAGRERLLALGDLRNLSVASSKGTYVCQWDDDDLYDPRRIAVQMGLIMSANVMAVFLSRWLIWWPARDVLALSGRRQWEGSMLAHRSVISVYPSMSRGEDSQIARLIADYHPTVLVDCPQMYCYRVTGENTFDASHFEQMLAHATKIFSDQEKRSMLSLPCFNQGRGTAA